MLLFVYGSLKQGECNFDQISPWVMSVRPAWGPGRMYLRPDGYPALCVEDTEQHDVAGEVLELRDPATALAHLDEFEGYFPGHDSEYFRILVPVSLGEGLVEAWTYVCLPEQSGDWQPIRSWPVTREAPAPYTSGRLKRPHKN